VRAEEAAVITDWISAGGTALVTFYSGTVDEQDRIFTGGYTGPFRDALGVRIEEFAPVAAGAVVRLSDGSDARLWSERGRATTADVVASFTGGAADGSPAITRNSWGEGSAWYLATLPSADAYRDLMARIVSEVGLTPPASVVGELGALELVRRRSADQSYLFIVNHGAAEVTVDATGLDLVTETAMGGHVVVPAGAVRIIREESIA
jgi:beta-galactosidase